MICVPTHLGCWGGANAAPTLHFPLFSLVAWLHILTFKVHSGTVPESVAERMVFRQDRWRKNVELMQPIYVKTT